MTLFFDSSSNESTAIEVGEEMAPWTQARVIPELDPSPVVLVRPITFTKSKDKNAEDIWPNMRWDYSLEEEMEFDRHITP